MRENLTGSLGALAEGIAVKIVTGQGVLLQNFRILKSVIFAHIVGLTAAEADGLTLGLANASLSVTEIKECLEVNGPMGPSQRVAQEQAERFCRLISQVEEGSITTTVATFRAAEGGSMIVIKPRWTFTDEANGWDFFVYNDGVVLTTGATCRILATHYGVWVD